MEIDLKACLSSPADQKFLRAYAGQLCAAHLVRRLEGFIHNLNGPLQILWLRSEQLEKEIGGLCDGRDETVKGGQAALGRKLRGRLDSFLKAFKQLDDSLKFITKDGVTRCRRGFEVLSLKDVLAEVLFLMKADMFFKHQVEVDFVPTEKVTQVLAQHNYLAAVFLSLIQNALEAMVSSPVRRLVIEVDTDNRMGVTRVRDTGCGVDDRNIERLFAPFFTTKDGQEYDGEVVNHQGLGLSLTAVLVSDYKGQMAVETNPDGTTFSVALPLHVPPE